MTFDLVIPVYNPSANWEISLAKNLDSLVKDSHLQISLGRIIIVNDGSLTNFTSKEINFFLTCDLPVEIIGYAQNRGKGFALREGVKRSTNDYCIYTDADMPFGVDSIMLIAVNLQKGFDIVAGCRNKDLYFSKAPLKRKIISKILMSINKYVLDLSLDDTQAGLKGFNSYGRELFLKTTIESFLFDLEFILLATSIQQLNIGSVNVMPSPEIELSSFKAKVLIQESLNLCKIIFKRKKIMDVKKDIAWI